MSLRDRLRESGARAPLYWPSLLGTLAAGAVLLRNDPGNLLILTGAYGLATLLVLYRERKGPALAAALLGSVLALTSVETPIPMRLLLLPPLTLFLAGSLGIFYSLLTYSDRAPAPWQFHAAAIAKTAPLVAASGFIIFLLPRWRVLQDFLGGDGATTAIPILIAALACLLVAAWGWEPQDPDAAHGQD